MPARTATPTAAPQMGESADPSAVDEEALADQAAEDIFGSEENARNTAGLITSFVDPGSGSGCECRLHLRAHELG